MPVDVAVQRFAVACLAVASVVVVDVDVARAAPSDGPLVACRKAYQAFDPQSTVVACQAAADDPRVPVDGHVDALRMLAMGHALRGDDALAALAYRRMLLLDHEAAPDSDAGPRFLEIYIEAKARFLAEGRVNGRGRVVDGFVVVDVDDALGRVDRARFLNGAELARVNAKSGKLAFRGALDENNTGNVDVELLGPTGKLVTTTTVDMGAVDADANAGDANAPSANAGAPVPIVPAALIASGAVLGVAGVGLGGVVVNDLYARVPCGAGGDQACLPRELFFGMYAGNRRDDFFAHSPAWLSVAGVGLAAGAALAVVGVMQLGASDIASTDAP